jgi:hypothetical protein
LKNGGDIGKFSASVTTAGVEQKEIIGSNRAPSTWDKAVVMIPMFLSMSWFPDKLGEFRMNKRNIYVESRKKIIEKQERWKICKRKKETEIREHNGKKIYSEWNV